jgi:hypothetical protein
MVLTVSFALSLVNRACLPPSPADMSCLSPVGPTRLRKLDASVGASGPRDFAVRCNISRPLAVDRSQVFQLALPSHRAQNAAASTASLPASVTIAIRPSVGWDGESSSFDLGQREQIFFGKSEIKDSTALSTNRPTGKSLEPVLLSAAVARMEPTGRREAPPDDRLRVIRGRRRVSPGFRCAPSGLRCSPTSSQYVGWVEPAKPIISIRCN